MPITGCGASLLDHVDLTPAMVDEVVIALHGLLKFFDLHRLSRHLGIFLQARHFHFRHDGPIPFGADVRHDTHRTETHLLAQFPEREELFDHRTRLPWLAIHDVSNEEHTASLAGFKTPGSESGLGIRSPEAHGMRER